MSHFLRPYQDEGERAIFSAWKEGYTNVMYQLVTGGGKTVLFVDIIKKILLAKKRVVLLAHREELITQAWNTLYKNEIFAGIIKADVRPNFALPCQVASIQTCARRSKLPPADFIIIDETHHALEDNSYGNLLLDHYPNARVLGFTATPCRLGGRGFTSLFQKLICGPPFKDLVAAGYLVPLRYFIASRPDLTRVSLSKGDYLTEEAYEAMRLAPLVESYLEHANGLCGLVFAVNVVHSRQIVTQYNAAGIAAAHVDADTPPEERRGIFKALAERRLKVVSNVGIATEGTDIPNIDFVQLGRPTKSLSMFLQMIGRGTRPIWEAIKNAMSDEERAYLVSQSSKPYAIILDNAGLWEEHGLPDQEIDWQRHFKGIPKRKKADATEQIEIIEFVAETSDGDRVVTKLPQEIEGLKLIEVNKSIKERVVNITSLKEFDKSLEMFKRMPKLGTKAGFAAVKTYKDYCRKNSILMVPQIWDYITKKLVHDPEDQEAKILSYLDRTIETINQNYGEDLSDRDNLIRSARELAEKQLAPFKKYKVPESYLKRERAEYQKKYEDLKALQGTVYEQ